MELNDVVRRRRMVRNFDPRPVAGDLIEQVLANGVRAPSAGFSQGWAFLVLDDPASVGLFWDTEWPASERSGPHTGVTQAPVVIVPLSSKDAYLERYAEPDKGWTDRDEGRWPTPYWHTDVAMASMLMLLTVVDVGLAALFFGVRRIDAVRDAFGIPQSYHPIGAIAIGYAAPDTPSPSLARGRRPLDQVVHRGRW